MKLLSIFTIFFSILIFQSNPSNAASHQDKKICSGFAKWEKDQFVQAKPSDCTTEKEYQAYLSRKDYKCQYYLKSIWKESERPYGKKQYQYTEEKLATIKKIKAEGKALCDAGKLKEGEAKLKEAITIISFTRMN